MGERHAGVGGDAERRGDAGHDFERDAGVGQRFGLFAAAAEDERVAAFEADDGEAAAGAVDQHGADFVLGECVGGFLLADVEALGVGRGEVEERVVGAGGRRGRRRPAARMRRPLTVMSSGSPGPAPTR